MYTDVRDMMFTFLIVTLPGAKRCDLVRQKPAFSILILTTAQQSSGWILQHDPHSADTPVNVTPGPDPQL